jgi:hypothetical protein|tara:strand:+ start:10145 stop:10423 length:279 start_codon:yes stop_codon:yes gene_type:complete
MSRDKETDHIEPFSPDLIPVKGKDGWYRDPESNAVVNCNKTEYDEYMAAYNRRAKKDEKFEALQNDVDGLKSDLSDIKNLLKTLIQGEPDAR